MAVRDPAPHYSSHFSGDWLDIYWFIQYHTNILVVFYYH